MGNDIETLQSILKDDPSNFQARRELSILLVNNGFNEEAEGNLRYLIKYFPEDAELHFNLGIVYEKLKDFPKAREAYTKAVDLSPQEDFYYNLGDVLVELKEWDEAISAFKKVLETDPKDGNSFFNLGVCYLNKEEKNLALDFFQKAVAMNPKDVFAYFYLGYIYQEDGLTNFAIESYQKVLEVSPDYSWAYFNLGSIAYRAGNLEEAKNYLLNTIQYNSRDFEAYKLLTKICLQQNEQEEILEILNTQLDKEENGDLFYCLARVYKYIGETDDYAENLENALGNLYTLTFPKDVVKQELEFVKAKLGRNEEIEADAGEIEEYQVEDKFEDDDYLNNFQAEKDDENEFAQEYDFDEDEADEDGEIYDLEDDEE